MKSCPTCSRTYADDIEFCPHDATRLTPLVSGTEAQLALGLARRFRIVRRLGVGGMGTVFLAEQIAVGNRPVALKVLNRKLLDDPEFLLRFQNEAGSTGRIHHPNVVTIYESAQADDGTPYIAMEFLEGESLREVLKKRGALPVAECAEILRQTAHGLNAAHKLGIIHRDLKPDNIFLTRSDEGELIVKVVDFGIAKLRESATHTLTGTLLGTPPYMSFEQASGMKSDDLDARSDVYSLGVVTYEMLTGRLPFLSDTPVGYLRKHLQEVPPPFRAVKPDLPVSPQVEAVVMRALTKDRDQRFASALEFAREFNRAASTPAPAEALPATKVVEPLDRGQAQQERQAREKAEAERREKEKAEAERLAQARAERERLVGEQAEAKRRGAERARVVPQQPNRAKYVILGFVALAVIVGGIWYFSPSGTKQETQQMQPTQPAEPAQQPTTAKAPEKTPEPAFQKAGLAAGEVKENSKDGLKYVWIPPGTFMMGCSPGDKECDPDEKPSHQVTISKGFWIGQTEVTVGAYKRFAQRSGRSMPPEPELSGRALDPGWGDEAMPIVSVSWDEAQAYCSWAGGRLPSEAEWEYAARAGSPVGRYGSLDEVAWYADNSGRERLDSTTIWNREPPNKVDERLKDNGNGMHEVARKRANGFGLYDMLGNVWEWVNDWYDEKYYQNSPSQDPPGPTSGQDSSRVLRGGSWYVDPRSVRVSNRGMYRPDQRFSDGGFRCGREVE